MDAANLGALALTHKSDIWLGRGSSENDRSLMAHELTHVLQQGAGIRLKPLDEAESEGAEPRDAVAPPVTVGGGLEKGAGANENQSGQPESEFVVSDAPEVQAAWYDFDIPFTDYQFDPSIEGVENAANIAKDTVVGAAETVGESVVGAAETVGELVTSGFEWIYEEIEGSISTGIDWLEDKFSGIKEFATSSFDTISNNLSTLLEYITSPVSMLQSAVQDMDADLLGMAWGALTSGATAVLQEIESVINGVLETGEGLWNTVSGYVDTSFGRVEDLINSWPFRQLPDFLQSRAQSLFDSIKSLWQEGRDYTTDLLARLKAFTDGILESIRGFVQRVVSYAIDTVVETVRTIKDASEFVTRIAEDPEGFIRPVIDQIEPS